MYLSNWLKNRKCNGMQNNLSYFHVIKELVRTDLKIFKKVALSKWVDVFIWILVTGLVSAYIMPALGVANNYGAFMVATMCSTSGLFQAFGYIAEMLADFEGDKVINYNLTLPFPSWMVFLRLVIFYTISFMFLGCLVLPVGKLMLWNSFSLTSVFYGKYLLMFVVSNVFYAVFALWITSFVPTLNLMDRVWVRMIFPLWFLGCFQFSWAALQSVSPVIAYLDLLNPITYVAEGMRAAILGQEGSLNFWACLTVLVVFAVFCGWHAMVRLKKRLDFV